MHEPGLAALSHAKPSEVRAAIREGRWTGNTKRLALGFHQANVTILPEKLAFDFMRYCLRNPRSLPLLDVTDPGDPVPRKAAPGGLRFDLAGWLAHYGVAPTSEAGLTAELQLQHAVVPIAPVDAIATNSTGSAYLEALLMDPAYQLK